MLSVEFGATSSEHLKTWSRKQTSTRQGASVSSPKQKQRKTMAGGSALSAAFRLIVAYSAISHGFLELPPGRPELAALSSLPTLDASDGTVDGCWCNLAEPAAANQSGCQEQFNYAVLAKKAYFADLSGGQPLELGERGAAAIERLLAKDVRVHVVKTHETTSCADLELASVAADEAAKRVLANKLVELFHICRDTSREAVGLVQFNAGGKPLGRYYKTCAGRAGNPTGTFDGLVPFGSASESCEAKQAAAELRVLLNVDSFESVCRRWVEARRSAPRVSLAGNASASSGAPLQLGADWQRRCLETNKRAKPQLDHLETRFDWLRVLDSVLLGIQLSAILYSLGLPLFQRADEIAPRNWHLIMVCVCIFGADLATEIAFYASGDKIPFLAVARVCFFHGTISFFSVNVNSNSKLVTINYLMLSKFKYCSLARRIALKLNLLSYFWCLVIVVGYFAALNDLTTSQFHSMHYEIVVFGLVHLGFCLLHFLAYLVRVRLTGQQVEDEALDDTDDPYDSIEFMYAIALFGYIIMPLCFKPNATDANSLEAFRNDTIPSLNFMSMFAVRLFFESQFESPETVPSGREGQGANTEVLALEALARQANSVALAGR